MLKEGPRGAVVPNARAHHSGGTGSLVEAVVGAQGGLAGGSSPQGPGTPVLGDGESYPGGGRCSRRAYGGQQPPRPGQHLPLGTGSPAKAVLGAQGGSAGAAAPKARAHQSWGTGSLVEAVVGAQGGPTGGSSSQGPGNISPWGRGVLSRQWSVLKEGLREAEVPKARAHQSGGTGSLVQAVVGAQGGPAGGSSPKARAHQPGRMGTPAQAVVGALGGSVGRLQFTTARAHHPGGTGSPVKAVVGALRGPPGGSSPQGPGTRA